MMYFRQTLRKDCVEAINTAVTRMEELEVYVVHPLHVEHEGSVVVDLHVFVRFLI